MGVKILQEEVKETFCDYCKKNIREGRFIRLDIYCYGSYEDNYAFDTPQCLRKWLQHTLDKASTICPAFPDVYDYHLSLDGDQLTELVKEIANE